MPTTESRMNYIGRVDSVSAEHLQETYRHFSISRSNDEIRLLSVDQDSQDASGGPRRWHLRPATTEDSYFALSYVWGEPGNELAIDIDGYLFYIRHNLYEFLQSVSSYLTTTSIWVDAICIDQSSVDERNHQVGLMGQIYRRAHGTVSWLGHTNHLIDQLFLELQVYNDTKFESLDLAIDVCLDLWYKHQSSKNTDLLSALYDILKNDYWTRTWIIQEIVLARRSYLMIDEKMMTFETLSLLILASKSYAVRSIREADWQQIAIPFDVVKELRQSKADHTGADDRGSTSIQLYKQLGRHSFQCFDQRDHLYAILSLLHNSAEFPIDYNIEVWHLALQTLVHFRPPRDVSRNAAKASVSWSSMLTFFGLPASTDVKLFAFDILYSASFSKSIAVSKVQEFDMKMQATYTDIDNPQISQQDRQDIALTCPVCHFIIVPATTGSARYKLRYEEHILCLRVLDQPVHIGHWQGQRVRNIYVSSGTETLRYPG